MQPLRLAVFVSGRGSNLRAIVNAVSRGTLHAQIVLVLSSTLDAPALDFAKEHKIRRIFPGTGKGLTDRTATILGALSDAEADFIALAGYMKLVEPEVVAAYRNRIVNIHPALLPAFGGKGMYGHHVHEAVLASGAKLSGATVHLVDEAYDRGPIVAQRAVPVLAGDTPDTLAARVLQVEHTLYPETLQLFAEGRITVEGQTASISGTPPAYYQV